jgi:hypothetical protein
MIDVASTPTTRTIPLSPFLELDFRAGMNFLTIEVERFFRTITIYCKKWRNKSCFEVN